MIDFDALWRHLDAARLGHWRATTEQLIRSRLSDSAHGDFAAWRKAIEDLQSCDAGKIDEIRRGLLRLAPWRKGPFELAGIRINSEWRSDLKWARLANAIAPLTDRLVLDVGCGNGYYALQMRAAGARTVIGVDPTLLYVMQFLAIGIFLPATNVFVLPLRSEELPQDERRFDTCFSMGVLYHQRSPLQHLRQLRGMLRPAGQLVLETIILPGDGAAVFSPPGRYARMRNVWLLPTVTELTLWLQQSGYSGIQLIDVSVTTVEEQRTTEWMPFESLCEALDPADPGKTVEGWPAPHRAILLANAS
ncbi:MAG: tRNA 5-methoxyuridine(34)/uridine 5-oxyacetic acid(34) synthase CmoB [Gammaproteobacteria bacterium]|nr:tRNA 5-methoxyuridine(34)/uridine 5-oxyacetic acid(34) synthase CmoB [Gammaproteobacteria bacterium]MDH5303405.1 tRNA 5-methoxyuridine(34)/uridine 5-oxyacetic acid(34) synthase CmoB [Gammaproteobacteria bacterium]MDH5322484.1 tRNA 5-methoxyuridine(34)/uridine 5-oxyacetic acid(34) synthase CmoB [Gammaproteobacteria bacterium]